MPRVVLFKTQNGINGSDAYRESFAQAGFEVQYIPVLQEEFHVDELSQLISDNRTDWGGVVITSKRGAEGWVQATKRHEDAPSSNSEFHSAVAMGDLLYNRLERCTTLHSRLDSH
jgi:uroporphyrinogen-III synthase